MTTTNLIPCSVPIRLDGQDYVVRYRALAFIKYASETGSDLLNDIRRIGTDLAAAGAMQNGAGIGGPITTMRDVLWAGLVDAQPILKRDDVARMFGFREIEPIMKAITDALRLSMPEIELTPDRPIEVQSLLPSTNGRGSGLSSENESDLAPMISGI
jgi:hypothetical protein